MTNQNHQLGPQGDFSMERLKDIPRPDFYHTLLDEYGKRLFDTQDFAHLVETPVWRLWTEKVRQRDGDYLRAVEVLDNHLRGCERCQARKTCPTVKNLREIAERRHTALDYADQPITPRFVLVFTGDVVKGNA